MILKGIVASPGKSLGKALCVRALSETDTNGKSGVSREETALNIRRAIDETSKELEGLSQRLLEEGKNMKSEIVGVQNFMLKDRMFQDAVHREVEAGYSAEASVQRGIDTQCRKIQTTANSFLKERIEDIHDVGSRIVCHIRGIKYPDLSDLSEVSVLVADEIPPSLLANTDSKYVKGILLSKSSKTSHVAILATNMGIPMLVGCRGLGSITEGQTVYLDAVSGEVHTDLTQQGKVRAEAEIESYREKQNFLKKYIQKESVTADGTRVYVYANLMDARRVDSLTRIGMDGVGLFRTEFLYMNREELPSEEEQFSVFRNAVKQLKGFPLTIRTMDIGGDKKVRSISIPKEANPFLGFRAIRICLARPQLILDQLRAALRASAYGPVRVMFPMISSVDEVDKCLKLLEKAKESLRKQDIRFDEKTPVGIMVEIPAAALVADKLAKKVDFFSIGSNDLIQYTLAADRTNEKVADIYSGFHPAVLKLIGMTITAAEKAGKGCALCGEMGADPLAVPLLLGLGLRRFSVNPSSILMVRHLIAQCDISKAHALSEAALSAENTGQVKKMACGFVSEEYRKWL